MTSMHKKVRVERALAEAGVTLLDEQVDALCDTVDAMDRLRSLLRDEEDPRHRYVEPAHTFRLADEGQQ